jgi:hypothetical protein
MEKENNIIPGLDPNMFCVTRIGFGSRLHISWKSTPGNRLVPACGLDSPFSRAIDTGRPLADITCKHCKAFAIKRKLI